MKKIAFLGLFALSTLLISCEEDDNNTNNNQEPTDTKVTPKFMYDYNFGADDFQLDQYYALDGGAQVSFSLASFYISQPTLVDDNDVETPLTPEYIIVRPGDGPTSFDAIESGHAHRLKFNVGIDAATNTENGASGVQPSDFTDPNHPLAPQPEGMYWSWASGYIFVKLEGAYDYDGDSQADTTFKYHLGVNDLLQVKDVMLHSDMAGGEDFEVDIKLDLKQVFTNLDINTEVLTMTMGGPENKALATKIIQNFANGISVEKHDHGSH